VIAGFPWFGEWGRDTCIALPGLLLPQGRVEECGEALAGLASQLRGGRLPNRFGATVETNEHAAADPALWFARAVRLWEQAGGGGRRVEKELHAALAAIARGVRDSKADDLSMDEAGLLRGKTTTATAATWMDAICDGKAVTPRDGCAVEVNALWYFLLDYLARLARRAGRPREGREWTAMKDRAGAAFVARFWLDDERRLADVWTDGVIDRRVRPNMVIAAALEFSPLTRPQRAAVVDVARAELLTPRGLRTLSPRDPDYRGRYEGDVRSRDAAYHQGTVWPWLFGFYAEAHLRAHGRGRGAKQHVRDFLRGFAPHIEEGALGQVAEVFDGDPPHAPGGAWAQAWSVAELCRAFALLK
jgi:predicted glycogen debranching enzyme